MPELCRFYGLLIKIQYRDHARPHIHIWYKGRSRAKMGIQDAQIIEGSLPRSQLALVTAWVYLHQQELFVAWDRAEAGVKPGRIAPLR